MNAEERFVLPDMVGGVERGLSLSRSPSRGRARGFGRAAQIITYLKLQRFGLRGKPFPERSV